MKNYKFGFDIQAFLIFFVIMIPNLIWFFQPAPHDILRQTSRTSTIDILASVFQGIMIVLLCLIKRPNAQRSSIHNIKILLCMISIGLYFLCWILYYLGYTDAWVILCLAFLPCFAFLSYESLRNNYLAMIPTLIFAFLHCLATGINFIY